MMRGREKSESAIVAGKPTNKAERSAAEPVEPRAEAKGNAGQQSTHRAQYRERVSKALACIRQHIAAVDTRGGSRMRESCTYGSERGARGNSRPYRDPAPGKCVLSLRRPPVRAEMRLHGIEITALPAAVAIARLAVRNVAVPDADACPVSDRL